MSNFRKLNVKLISSLAVLVVAMVGCQSSSQGGSNSGNPPPAPGASAPASGRAEMIVVKGDGSNLFLGRAEIQNSNANNVLHCYVDQRQPNQIMTIVGFKADASGNKRFLIRLELDLPLHQGLNVLETETKKAIVVITDEVPSKNVPLHEDLRDAKVPVGGCYLNATLTNATLDGRINCDQVLSSFEDVARDLKIPKFHCDLEVIK